LPPKKIYSSQESVLDKHRWFFAELKNNNNNLVKQDFNTIQIEDIQILFGSCSINIYLCII